jgi:hypothetical protein
LTIFELQSVVHAARRIGADPDGYESCGMIAPCAEHDMLCRCTRLAKLALGIEGDVSGEYDALPEGVQF